MSALVRERGYSTPREELPWTTATTRSTSTICASKSSATDRPMVCGHRAGDSFELRGENLSLPAGPVVLHLRAGGAAAAAAGEAAGHASARLDDDGRRDRVSRSQLRRAIPHHASRHPDVPASRRHGRSARLSFALPMSTIPRVELAPGYTISRVLKGGWQLAGGHGPVEDAAALDDMDRFVEAGVTTFDCADIYTGVETLIGRWLKRRRGRGGARPVQVHTKYVPDLDRLPTHSRADVVRGVDRSLARLGVERLDLVQLHWWDYDVPRLRRSGRVARRAAAGREDPPRRPDELRPAASVGNRRRRRPRSPRIRCSIRCSTAGRPRVSPHNARETASACSATVPLAGGFLSDRYLGEPDPVPPLENRSLVKYRLIIDEFGGWDRFQEMLAALGRDRLASRGDDRRRGHPLGPRSARRLGRHRRRAARASPRPDPEGLRAGAGRRRIAR